MSDKNIISFEPRPRPQEHWKMDLLGHQWVMIAVYSLSRNEIQIAQTGSKVHLDTESLVKLAPVSCQRCEMYWDMAADIRCPGDPTGYAPDGLPIHKDPQARLAIELFRQRHS